MCRSTNRICGDLTGVLELQDQGTHVYFSESHALVVQVVLKDVNVQEILWPSPLDYVLVVLAAGTTQKQLEEMRVDGKHLESLADKKNLTGIIVTCAGIHSSPLVYACASWLVHLPVDAHIPTVALYTLTYIGNASQSAGKNHKA